MRIYIAIRKWEDRSHFEDELVLEDVNVSCFPSAQELWESFRAHPSRFVITDRRFGDHFDGLQLVRMIRLNAQLPYVYILMRSVMAGLEDIKQGLDLGVDDYLVRPHNPFEIRARVLVGLRWLGYIDSITRPEAKEGFQDQGPILRLPSS
jgi:DNA-binding response OmpR family regulator